MPSKPSTHQRIHRKAARSHSDDIRVSQKDRGLGKQWSRVAKMARDRDAGLCQDCLAEGGMPMAIQSLLSATQAHPVDHVIPRHVDPSKWFDLDNLRTLCPYHHRLKTLRDIKQYGVDTKASYGWLSADTRLSKTGEGNFAGESSTSDHPCGPSIGTDGDGSGGTG